MPYGLHLIFNSWVVSPATFAQKISPKKIKECVTVTEINYLGVNITFREKDTALSATYNVWKILSLEANTGREREQKMKHFVDLDDAAFKRYFYLVYLS